MTADAKIGLLLGLMFIVIIAFLLTGLPDFLQKGSDGVIETAITPDNENTITVNQAVSSIVENLEPASLRRAQPPQTEQVVADFSRDEPVQTPIGTGVTELPDAQPELSEVIELPSQPRHSRIAGSSPVAYGSVSTSTSESKTHVVQSGENLAEIAMRYYGKENGNRRVTVQRLYEVNNDILESPDKIRQGDKLTIPPYGELMNPTRPSAQGLLNRFQDLFEPAGQTEMTTRAGTRPASGPKVYTVREGDRLWDIADELLGTGNRYMEIARLNKIKNPDFVPAGTRLKIPVR